MILKLCKKISQKDANRIKEINKKIITLQRLQDVPFLKEDLEQKSPIWKAENQYIEFLIDEKIGPIIIDSKCKMGRTNSNIVLFSKEEKKIENVNFAIIMSKATYPTPTAIRVSATIENMNLHTKDICIDPISGGIFGNIYSLAIYFYNKLDAYKKIKNCLVKNEKNLENQISKSYVKDMIKLFSASGRKRNIKDYSVSKKFVSKEKCLLNIPSVEDKAIAIVEYSYYVKGHLIKDVEICLSIEENNIFTYHIIPNYGVEISEDPELLDFLNDNTNKWLKNLEEMTSFGYAISKKVKTKLLINNI